MEYRGWNQRLDFLVYTHELSSTLPPPPAPKCGPVPQHDKMRPCDLITMKVVKVVANVSATASVSVGGKQVNFVKKSYMVSRARNKLPHPLRHSTVHKETERPCSPPCPNR